MSRANAFAFLDSSDDEEPVKTKKTTKATPASAPKKAERSPRQNDRRGRGGRGGRYNDRRGGGRSDNDGVSTNKYGRERYNSRREGRGGKSRSGKGRGGGRSNERRSRNDYDRRQHDRGDAKKGGHGRGGWGSEKDQVNQATEEVKDTSKEGEDDQISSLMTAEEEPEVPELTIEEYRAEQKAKQAAFQAKYGKKKVAVERNTEFSGKVMGKNNTGSAFSSSKTVVSKKTKAKAVKNKDLRALIFAEPSHNFDTSDREDRPRGKGRGKGRGGKGRGRGKGRGKGRGARSNRSNKSLNTNSLDDFPTLG